MSKTAVTIDIEIVVDLRGRRSVPDIFSLSLTFVNFKNDIMFPSGCSLMSWDEENAIIKKVRGHDNLNKSQLISGKTKFLKDNWNCSSKFEDEQN